MDGKLLISQIRADVQAAESSGRVVVFTRALDTYLAKLVEGAVLSPEAQEQQHQHSLARFTAENAAALEGFRATITAGQAALRSALLINGGATVALLSLLGAGWSKGAPATLLSRMPLSLAYFAFGVLSAAVAGGATYLSQEMYQASQERFATPVKGLAIACGMASYVLFALGVLVAYRAFVTG